VSDRRNACGKMVRTRLRLYGGDLYRIASACLSIHVASTCCQRTDWLQVGLPIGGAIARRQASPATNLHDPIGSPASPTRRPRASRQYLSPSVSRLFTLSLQILISATNTHYINCATMIRYDELSSAAVDVARRSAVRQAASAISSHVLAA